MFLAAGWTTYGIWVCIYGLFYVSTPCPCFLTFVNDFGDNFLLNSFPMCKRVILLHTSNAKHTGRWALQKQYLHLVLLSCGFVDYVFKVKNYNKKRIFLSTLNLSPLKETPKLVETYFSDIIFGKCTFELCLMYTSILPTTSLLID